MPHIDVEILTTLTARLVQAQRLTPSERGEVLRLAQGFGCKESASAANISPETIRARRKRIYRKLDVAGANDLISVLLALSLGMLARGERLGAPAMTVTMTMTPEAGVSAGAAVRAL